MEAGVCCLPRMCFQETGLDAKEPELSPAPIRNVYLAQATTVLSPGFPLLIGALQGGEVCPGFLAALVHDLLSSSPVTRALPLWEALGVEGMCLGEGIPQRGSEVGPARPCCGFSGNCIITVSLDFPLLSNGRNGSWSCLAVCVCV